MNKEYIMKKIYEYINNKGYEPNTIIMSLGMYYSSLRELDRDIIINVNDKNDIVTKLFGLTLLRSDDVESFELHRITR